MEFQRELNRYMALCSRREYAGSDIISALRRKGASEEEARELIKKLKENGFVDDRRYVKAFVKDKMILAGWGRTKVEYQLKMKGFESDIIREAIEDLDIESTEDRMLEVIERKYRSLNREEDLNKKRAKVIRFALSRGFSYNEIIKVLNKIESNNDNI